MDPMTMLSGYLDGGSVGAQDAGIVGSITGMTEFIKDWLNEHGLKPKLDRFYPFLPFVVAFVNGYLTQGNLKEAIEACVIYGAAATSAFRIAKVSFAGK